MANCIPSKLLKGWKIPKDISTVPELEIMTAIHPSNTKTHYSKCSAPLQRPFLLAGELASPAAEIKCY